MTGPFAFVRVCAATAEAGVHLSSPFTAPIVSTWALSRRGVGSAPRSSEIDGEKRHCRMSFRSAAEETELPGRPGRNDVAAWFVGWDDEADAPAASRTRPLRRVPDGE